MLSGAKHLQYLLENNPLQVLRSPENRTDDVIPAKAGIQFFRTWTPACAGVTTLIFHSLGWATGPWKLRRKSRHSREGGNPPDVGPRLRGDDDVCNFQVDGWAKGPWALRTTARKIPSAAFFRNMAT